MTRIYLSNYKTIVLQQKQIKFIINLDTQINSYFFLDFLKTAVNELQFVDPNPVV